MIAPSSQSTNQSIKVRSGAKPLSRWREHFDNIINANAGRREETTWDGIEVQVVEGEIEMKEVKRAMRKLKSEKAGRYVAYK